MSTLANHAFVKMNGLGNEIVVVDLRAQGGTISADEARAAAQPKGAPYDQLMALHAPRTPGTDAFVRIFNNDGSEAGACGNGMRCVADILFKESRNTLLTAEKRAGRLKCWQGKTPLTSTIDMGLPRLKWDEIPLAEEFGDTRRIDLQIGPVGRPILHSPSVANMGNPHAVFWLDDVNAYDLGEIGPLLETHPILPDRANISLAQVISREYLIVRTWERGAGLTRACGSAACAAVVCASRIQRTGRKATVSLPGGALDIEWRGKGAGLVTGPRAYWSPGRCYPRRVVT